jgi:hydrogenase expression/formation protein HypC
MCLAVPGKIESVTGDAGPMTRRGRVDFAGIVKEVNLSLVPHAGLGDYVLVHAGIAIQRVDREEAEKTLGYFREIGELEIAAREGR